MKMLTSYCVDRMTTTRRISAITPITPHFRTAGGCHVSIEFERSAAGACCSVSVVRTFAGMEPVIVESASWGEAA